MQWKYLAQESSLAEIKSPNCCQSITYEFIAPNGTPFAENLLQKPLHVEFARRFAFGDTIRGTLLFSLALVL
jgi:hypothetical protein